MICVYVTSMSDYIRGSHLQICNLSRVIQVSACWEGTTVREFNPLNRAQPTKFPVAERLGRWIGYYGFHRNYMSDSCRERLWAKSIWWKLVLAVISISSLPIDLTSWHRRQVSYIYCEGILRVLVRAGYIQICLRSIKNLLLSIFHPRIAWDGKCRLWQFNPV